MNDAAPPLQTVTDKLIAAVEGAIGWVVFNNPARHNATSFEMWQALPLVLDAYAGDPAVRAIVFRGAGEKAFSAGADISQFKEKRTTPEAAGAYNRAADAANRALRECPKPTIAMIRGYCIGGGTAVAVGCDIRIASDAAKMAAVFTRRGVLPESGGTCLLPRLVGWAKAAEIAFTGRVLSAQESLEAGLVNKVVPADSLMTESRALATEIARNAPMAVQATKRMMRLGLDETFEANVHHVYLQLLPLFRSHDFTEGVKAFIERREPVFEGR
jgi:enoyl-CoA hydratase/carnithine racemase